MISIKNLPEPPAGKRYCPSCYELIGVKEKHETVLRVVRAHNKIGDAGPGELVEIEPRHLNGALEDATMSLEDHEKIQALVKKPKPQKKGMLTEMVERSLLSAKAEVQSTIDRGKQWIEREREKAIAEGKDLPKDAPPSDLEPPSRETQDVTPGPAQTAEQPAEEDKE